MHNIPMFKIGYRIIIIPNVTYISFTPEGAIDVSQHRSTHHLEDCCEVYQVDGTEHRFYGAEATQVWAYLSVAATNITPSKREVTA